MNLRSDMRDVFTHIAFATLGILAVYWYGERMYADAAYYLFHCINLENFHIEHGRYVLAISQFVPLLAVKAGLPLSAVLVLYSLGHVFFYYLIFLISRYRYGNKGAGMLLVLLQVLGLEMGYFSPMFELYYGTAILVLVATILWSDNRKAGDYVLLLTAMIFVLSSHPMAVLLSCFTVVLYAIEFRLKGAKLYAGFVVCLVLYVLWKSMTASAYESGAVSSILNTYRTMPFGMDYLTTALAFLVRHHLAVLILFVGSITWLYRQKDRMATAFVVIALAGMFVVIHGVHYGFQHSRYQEQVYFPLSYIAAFPFCVLVNRWEGDKSYWRRLMLGVIVVLFALRIHGISKEAPNFERRIAMMERQIGFARMEGIDKALCGEANVTRHTSVDPNWSYGIETLLLAGRDGPANSVSIVFDTDMEFEQNASRMQADEFLMRKWDIKPLTWLNPGYFKLASGPYMSITTAGALDTITDAFAHRVIIDFPAKRAHASSGEWISVDVEVVNNSDIVIPADTTMGMYFAYHWKQGDSIVVWDGHRTPFEVRLGPGRYHQGVDVLVPGQKGQYSLLVDIVAEERRWLGIDAAMEFSVK